RRKGCAQENIRGREAAGGDRSVRRRCAWMVSPGLGRLQRAAGGKGVDPPARVIRQSARVAIRVWTGHPVCIVAGRGGVAFWPDSDVALQILPESAQALIR